MVKPSEAQIDALKEVGNIGASHASDVLGQMLSKTVIINVPKATFLPVEKMSKIFGEEDDAIVILFFLILGDVEGYMVISFSESQAALISNYLMGTNDDRLELTEEKESALKEVGNILASAYLTAMSDLAGFRLRPSVPYITYDIVETAVNPIMEDIGQTAEYALITDNEFLLDGKSIAGKCITFYNRESFTKILEALGLDTKK
jgi:chemotaxis protein CheC